MFSSGKTSSFDRFTKGSLFRHVVFMTFTGSLGLKAIFIVELTSLFFLSRLKDHTLIAAMGYCSPIVFSVLSLGLGFSIAASVWLSRSIGAKKIEEARRIATHAVILSMGVMGFAGLFVLFTLPWLLTLLHATAHAGQKAGEYISLFMFFSPFLGGSVLTMLALRAIGDVNGSMVVTLLMAIVNALLDPIFIFYFKMDVRGAALGAGVADFISCMYGVFLLYRHGFLIKPSFKGFYQDLFSFAHIACPVIVSQLATPFMQGYLAHAASAFGAEVVSAVAILNRLMPVVFGVVFALSGAIGPIIGQNFGAKRYDRVHQALKSAVLFAVAWVFCVSVALFFSRFLLVEIFQATGKTQELLLFYCVFLGILFVFPAIQFICQAIFNALHYPYWSMTLNWAGAFMLVPFVFLGARWYGDYGMLLGSALAPLPFSVFALLKAWFLTKEPRVVSS